MRPLIFFLFRFQYCLCLVLLIKVIISIIAIKHHGNYHYRYLVDKTLLAVFSINTIKVKTRQFLFVRFKINDDIFFSYNISFTELSSFNKTKTDSLSLRWESFSFLKLYSVNIVSPLFAILSFMNILS